MICPKIISRFVRRVYFFRFGLYSRTPHSSAFWCEKFRAVLCCCCCRCVSSQNDNVCFLRQLPSQHCVRIVRCTCIVHTASDMYFMLRSICSRKCGKRKYFLGGPFHLHAVSDLNSFILCELPNAAESKRFRNAICVMDCDDDGNVHYHSYERHQMEQKGKWHKMLAGIFHGAKFSGLQRNGCRNPIDQSQAALNLKSVRDDHDAIMTEYTTTQRPIPINHIELWEEEDENAEMMTKWKKLWIPVDQCVMNWFTFPFSSAYSLNDVVLMICSICDWITSDLSLPRSLSLAISLSLWRCFICFRLYSFTSVAWEHKSTHHLRRHTWHVVSLGAKKLHRRATWLAQSSLSLPNSPFYTIYCVSMDSKLEHACTKTEQGIS